MAILETIGPWIALIVTACILSLFLWKDNIAFRFAQVTLIAGASSIALIFAVKTIVQLTIEPLMAGIGIDAIIFTIISISLGVMVYGRITTGYSWSSMWPMTFVVGVGMGLSMRSMVGPQIVDQIKATIQPLNSINAVLIVISVFATMSYFIFSDYSMFKSKTLAVVLSTSSKIGRYVLMVTFGTLYGTVSMTRMSWLLGRISEILQTLGLLPVF